MKKIRNCEIQAAVDKPHFETFDNHEGQHYMNDKVLHNLYLLVFPLYAYYELKIFENFKIFRGTKLSS